MQKIAILGGGIGSLATAAELTNDPDWRSHYEITIYQMGWRLGGKGASGRNRKVSDRIQEHGIHLWMGFYENAFEMIRKVYDEAKRKNLMPGSPFVKDRDDSQPIARNAFSPMNFTPMMEKVDKDWKQWDLTWPSCDEFPGEPVKFEEKELPPTPFDFVNMILERTTGYLHEKKDDHQALASLYKDVAAHLCDAVGATLVLHPKVEPEGDHTLLHRIAAFGRGLAEGLIPKSPEVHLLLAKAIKAFSGTLLKAVFDLIHEDDDLRRFFIIVDTALATAAGMIEDDVLEKGFMAIEDQDLMDWLKKHGCHYPDSAITLGMYDACFGYENGDPEKPRMAAGSTLYGALRLMLTYRGSLMWWMNAGMGETIMSPIYLVLKSRGVQFKFFHKVKALHLSADGKEIDSIDIEIQATTKGDYNPLFQGKDGVPVWPTEPLWEQVVEAKAIQACKNPDLESWWTDWHGQADSLQRGRDFHLVVLGISLGAHKYICKDLIDKSDRWKTMVNTVGVVRTQALQLWMNKTLAESGWTEGRGILSGYVEPFDTWSDMSDLLPRERWPDTANVRQIAYFCNAIPDDTLRPFDDPEYPEFERQRVLATSRQFLDGPALKIFPLAEDPASPGHFNDAVLVNCFQDPERKPFETQFFRCNIDPSELYVLSLPGSTKTRLASHDSDFDNLFLAGDWTYTDLNIGCIEATVISGRMASRAICGKPDHIYGAFGSMKPIMSVLPGKEVAAD